MARTPKAPLPPAPARRSRKPKAEPGELALAAGGDAEPAEALPDEAPARGKPGRKPKVRPEAALPAAAGDEPPAMSVDQPDATAEPTPAGDDAMIAEMAGPVSAGDGESAGKDSAPVPVSTDTNGIAPASGQGGSEPLPPAAWWDRASDRVRFDWPAIERTASQEGPQQAMAKLLVAARAEGAHSRWPL